MKSLTRAARVCLVIATVVCFTFTSAVAPLSRSFAFTLSEENELGRKLLEKIRQHMQLVEDGEVLTYVQSVGNRIVEHLGTTPYEFRFFVINEPVPNAFAIPGGYVFIFRGLIEVLEDEGELASILSHELAHVQARHIERRMKEGRILSIASLAGLLAGILLASKTGASPALALGGAAGAQSAALKYSREFETEADQIGLRNLCEAGYDPKDMAEAMQRLEQFRFLNNARIPSYLSTHPAVGERVQYLNELARSHKEWLGKKRVSPTATDFRLMKAALIADYSEPARAMERFTAGVKKREAEAFYGMGRLYMRQGDNAQALSMLQEAVRLRPGSPFILSSLGKVYHQLGRLPEAQKALQTALLMDSSTIIAQYRLALVLQDQGKREEALEHLQSIQRYALSFPDIDYQMGIILGQNNRIGLAHYHLGHYYESKQDLKLALFHYQKARVLLRDSVEKMNELDKTIKALEKEKKESVSHQARR